MIKVIMGAKGSGKTKQLIDAITVALNEEKGNVVCIEKDSKLTYDLPHEVRLVDVADYSFGNAEFFKGMISGLHAGNYDITHIFIESIYKMVKFNNAAELENLLNWLNAFSEQNSISFTLTITDDIAKATEGIKKYF